MNTPTTTAGTTNPQNTILEKIKADHARLKAEAPNLTRRQCLELCHELTIAFGGKAADKRTRTYFHGVVDYFRICQSVQTPETLRRWDDEQMEESREAWAAKRAAKKAA